TGLPSQFATAIAAGWTHSTYTLFFHFFFINGTAQSRYLFCLFVCLFLKKKKKKESKKKGLNITAFDNPFKIAAKLWMICAGLCAILCLMLGKKYLQRLQIMLVIGFLLVVALYQKQFITANVPNRYSLLALFKRSVLIITSTLPFLNTL
ncbi:hypothetical protein RFI_37352, partial [Reticulomyxa filosa]